MSKGIPICNDNLILMVWAKDVSQRRQTVRCAADDWPWALLRVRIWSCVCALEKKTSGIGKRTTLIAVVITRTIFTATIYK